MAKTILKALAALASLALAAGSGAAQFNEYEPPGAFGARPENRRQALQEAIDGARWRLGALRLEPWAGVRDISYVDNATVSAEGRKESDVTATVGAGLRSYLPLSDDLTLAVHALPEYVWWSQLAERRQLNGRYGVGLFGFFARSSIELSLSRLETQRFVTSEAEQLVDARRDLAAAEIETRIAGSTSLYVSAGAARRRNLQDESEVAAGLPPVDRLDRDEELLGGGVRWRPRQDLAVHVGLERTAIDFLDPTNDRSNEGVSPVVGLRLDGDSLALEASLVLRDLEARNGSAFVPYSEPTGNLTLNLRPGSRLDFAFSVDRSLAFSFNPSYAYFESRRFGAAVELPLGWRTRLRLFLESGDNAYTLTNPDSAAPRSDDFVGYGLSLRIELGDSVSASLAASRSNYDSNLDVFDREVTVLRTGLVLGREGTWW